MVLSTPFGSSSTSTRRFPATASHLDLPHCRTPKKKKNSPATRVGVSLLPRAAARSTRRNLAKEEFCYITPRPATSATIGTYTTTSSEGAATTIFTPPINTTRKRGLTHDESPSSCGQKKKKKKTAVMERRVVDRRTPLPLLRNDDDDDDILLPLSPSLLFPFLSVEETKLLELPSIPDSPRGVASLIPRTSFLKQRSSIEGYHRSGAVGGGLAPRVLF